MVFQNITCLPFIISCQYLILHSWYWEFLPFPCWVESWELQSTLVLTEIYLRLRIWIRFDCQHFSLQERAVNTVAGPEWQGGRGKTTHCICDQIWLIKFATKRVLKWKGSTVQTCLHHPWIQAEVFLCPGPLTFLKSGLIWSHSGFASMVSAEVPFFPVHASCSNGKLHEWQCLTCILQPLLGRSHSSTACKFWKLKVDIKPHLGYL